MLSRYLRPVVIPVRSIRSAAACRFAAGAVLLAASAMAPAPASAQQPQPAQPAQQVRPATRPTFTLGFKPQANDASAKRVGGISRAGKRDPVYVSVIAPGDTVGKTTRDQ